MHRTTVRSRRRLRRILPAAVTPQSEEAEGCAVFIYLFIYLFIHLFIFASTNLCRDGKWCTGQL